MRRLLAYLVAATLTAIAAAQPSGGRNAPRLGFAYPAGAVRGSTVTITLGGQFLADASALHFSGTGLTARVTGYERPLTQKESVDLREEVEQLRKQKAATLAAFPAEAAKRLAELQATLARRNPRPGTPSLAESVTLELTVAPDTRPGTHELRLQTPAGLSNPLFFQIGTLPETSAPVVTATNSAPRRAAAASATKRSAPLEIALPALVNGQTLPGEIDSVRFAARRGQQIVCTLSARALIPYLADAVPGWFQAALHLRDAQGHELAFDDDYQFRPDPVLACTIPADGIYGLEIHDALYRGREDFVYRLAVGELPFIRSVFPLGAARQTHARVELSGWNLPVSQVEIDTDDRSTGPMQLSVRTDGHFSNGVRFAVGDIAETSEAEARPEPQRVPLPALVNGRISRPDEADIYRFAGKTGQAVVAEIFARRLDSPLDSRLTLHGPDGRQIATNDDWDDPAEGLLTHHADSRLVATLPADGDYTVTVTDTQHQGGLDHAYRLAIHPAKPDFELRVTPSVVNLPSGGSAAVTVHALRRDGFDGEIRLALERSDGALRLDAARIPGGVDSVQLTLTAAPNLAAGHAAPLQLLGTASVAGRDEIRAALPCDDTMQAFLYRHLVPASRWLAFINGRGIGFRVESPQVVRLQPGQTATIQLEPLGRGPTIAQPKAELINPPPGVRVTDCRARGRGIEVTLTLDSAPPATQAAGNLILSLSGARPQRDKGNAKPRPLGLAPAIPYEFAAVTAPAR